MTICAQFAQVINVITPAINAMDYMMFFYIFCATTPRTFHCLPLLPLSTLLLLAASVVTDGQLVNW
jgi:hypothetical protein